jgi:hypothetical protein
MVREDLLFPFSLYILHSLQLPSKNLMESSTLGLRRLALLPLSVLGRWISLPRHFIQLSSSYGGGSPIVV